MAKTKIKNKEWFRAENRRVVKKVNYLGTPKQDTKPSGGIKKGTE
jgi:hypothetical protein